MSRNNNNNNNNSNCNSNSNSKSNSNKNNTCSCCSSEASVLQKDTLERLLAVRPAPRTDLQLVTDQNLQKDRIRKHGLGFRSKPQIVVSIFLFHYPNISPLYPQSIPNMSPINPQYIPHIPPLYAQSIPYISPIYARIYPPSYPPSRFRV